MEDRLTAERHFHDAQANARRADRAEDALALKFDLDWYLDHETWVRPAIELLGELRGLTVLDYGCGHGMAGVVMARRGAAVTAFDLSAGYVAEAAARAAVNVPQAPFHVLQAAAERLPFTDASFDRVWGHAILHHLDLPRAAAELARVLRPGGWAVFCEPWGGNPVLEWARRRLPYPHKHRTRDERPLTAKDLPLLEPYFHSVMVTPFQLTGMVRRLWSGFPFQSVLDRFDGDLFYRWPYLGQFCRYVVLKLIC